MLLVGCKIVPRKFMVCFGPSSSYHNQNYKDYRSAPVIPICNPEYLVRIYNLIVLGHDWLRMDQDLTFTYEGQFYTQITAPIALALLSVCIHNMKA